MSNADDATVRRSASGHDLGPLDAEAIAALSTDLSDEEARVILRHGTEAAFCGAFYDHKTDGLYVCRLCGLPLFESNAKYDSGTGWPSFFQPVDPDHVAFVADDSHGMHRTEITCRRCGGHLGHVFPDGPPPSGERYCLNSVSLKFFDHEETLPDRSRPG